MTSLLNHFIKQLEADDVAGVKAKFPEIMKLKIAVLDWFEQKKIDVICPRKLTGHQGVLDIIPPQYYKAVLTDLIGQKAVIDGETNQNQSNDVLGLPMTPDVKTSEPASSVPAALGGGGLQNSGGVIPENGGEHQVNLDPNLNPHCYFNPDPIKPTPQHYTSP